MDSGASRCMNQSPSCAGDSGSGPAGSPGVVKPRVEIDRIGALPPVELPLIFQSREYESALAPVARTIAARRHVSAIEQVACIKRSRPAVHGGQRAAEVVTQRKVN